MVVADEHGHGGPASVYGIASWGQGYVSVNELGHMVVRPERTPGREIDLYELVRGLDARGICTPVLVRLTDLLGHRLGEIREAFDEAIRDNQYRGDYCCIYPIKVNQQAHVVEEVRDFAARLRFGLEAGSKPELLAVLGLTAGHPDMPIVCNGFKDREYIQTVVLAAKLGRRIIPVVERFEELEMIVAEAERYGVRPMIGVRIKPSAMGTGKWQTSAGPRSKFGLTASKCLHALEYLKRHGMGDCLRMLHFHIGSQITDIKEFKGAFSELAYTFTELTRLGAGLEFLDVGGGLGVDYDGSHTAWGSSVNYAVREYAADVVYRIKTACDDAGVPHPTILSESGRAMVAYSSVLLVDVLGRSRLYSQIDLDEVRAAIAAEDEAPQPVLDLIEAYSALDAGGDPVELYHDAQQAKEEALSLFRLGYISLPMRAAAERLFAAIGRRILNDADSNGGLHEELEDLPEQLADTYFCNFSLFQSLPDHWAIDQLFPICPIHRLDETPTRRGVLADVTCDSDGTISQFACQDTRDSKPVLELHELREGEPYYLGFFLAGAYQEVLGDLHNLFGDTNAVHVSIDAAGRWNITDVVEGDTVREVLEYVQFDVEDLEKAMRRDVERACKDGGLTVEEGRSLLNFYREGLAGYTYLE